MSHAPPTVAGGRSRAQRLWLVAAVAAAIAGALALRAADDGGSTAGTQPKRAALAPAELADPAGWTTYRDVDPRAVAPAADGGAWVATTEGLRRWDADGHGTTLHGSRRLADREVSALATTGDGTVWVATRATADGSPPQLLRFDGETWHTVGVPDIGGEAVIELVAGPDGGLWATSHEGLARRHDGAWTVHAPLADRQMAHVPHVTVDRSGAVWVAPRMPSATGARQVARFDDGTWRTWTVGEQLPQGKIRALATGGQTAWMVLQRTTDDAADVTPAVPGGSRLLRLDGSAWVVVADRLPQAGLRELVVDADGTPWVVAGARRRPPDREAVPGGRPRADRVVAGFVDGGWQRLPRDERPPGRVTELHAAGGELWATLARPGSPRPANEPVARFDGRTLTVYPEADGLTATGRVDLEVDRTGAVWGRFDDRLARFDDGAWTRVDAAEGPGEASWVADVAVDDDGAVWVATDGGVARLADGAWTRWTVADGLAANSVRSLAMGPDGAVWAATERGVSRFAAGQWTTWREVAGLTNPAVTSVTVADDGTVWAVLETTPRVRGKAYLARLADGRWTSWTDDGPLARHRPAQVAADGDGGVWVTLPDLAVDAADGAGHGDEAGGIAHFGGQTWQVYREADGLTDARVGALAVADSGVVWAGTDLGVSRFAGRRWVNDHTDGNPLRIADDDAVGHRSVSALAVGAGGAVWAATSDTLSRFDGDEWTAVAIEQLPIERPLALAVGPEALWVGAVDGLATFGLGEADDHRQ